MKTLKLLGLFVILISLSSCDEILKKLFGHEPDTICYSLALGFQDTFGNDLVKGIGLKEWCCPTNMPEEQAQSGTVKDSLYTLDITASASCENYMHSHTTGISTYSPQLGMQRYDNGYYFLTSDYNLFANSCPNEKIITYKLKCPYVFGDDIVHEIVTYWDIPKIRNTFAYATCNRIEFEGKVITQITYEDPQKQLYTSWATIILEGRNNP